MSFVGSKSTAALVAACVALAASPAMGQSSGITVTATAPAPVSVAVATPVAAASPVASPVASLGGQRAYRWHGHCGSCGGHRGFGLALGSLALLGTAITLHVVSANAGAESDRLYLANDPNAAMAPESYADVAAERARQQTFQNVAIGMYIGSGVLAVASIVMWALPRRAPSMCPSRRAPPPVVSFGASPSSLHMHLTF